MLRTLLMKLILAFALAFGAVAFAADTPTIHQIYQAAEAGRLNEAESMVQQVLKEHPNSAKAHYVNAEILAKEGRLAQAQGELKAAEKLEPGLPFAKPQAVQELRARVAGSSYATSTTAATGQASFPWGLLLLGIGFIVVLALIARALSNRSNPTTVYSGGYQPGLSGQPVPGGTYTTPSAPAAPGMGSGIMTGLATGAALGAGMVAGEALAHHFIDGERSNATVPSVPPADNTWGNQPDDDMGGSDFGITDNSSWDDNSGIADISGGDDWT